MFTPMEQNYDIYKRELLAIMKALTHWRQYLGWMKYPFIIHTNHTNLQYWKSPRNLNRRTAQWHADLQEYDYEIEYIPGKNNEAADALSRPPRADHGKNDNQGIIMIPPHHIRTITTHPAYLLPIPAHDEELKRTIMTLLHDHPTAGHPGRDETLQRTQLRYHWKGMKDWIADYVKGCTTCQQNKVLTHKPCIPLFQIDTLLDTKPFQRVAMDLITGLPTHKGMDAILTIMDHRCSRAAIFIPCSTTITRPRIAQLYFEHVYRWFGLPNKIISDRDPCFTSHFSHALAQKLKIDQNMSTAFHPQTDRLSERKNQWIEQYLQLMTSNHPEHWMGWLPLAMAVHNNWKNTTTGLTPNQILWGYDIPLIPDSIPSSTNEMAERRIQQLTEYRKEAIDALNRTAHHTESPTLRY
jgi:hypothetical protein